MSVHKDVITFLDCFLNFNLSNINTILSNIEEDINLILRLWWFCKDERRTSSKCICSSRSLKNTVHKNYKNCIEINCCRKWRIVIQFKTQKFTNIINWESLSLSILESSNAINIIHLTKGPGREEVIESLCNFNLELRCWLCKIFCSYKTYNLNNVSWAEIISISNKFE